MKTAVVRARQLLSLLPEGKMIGAEIGVWRGSMSRELLKRKDMTLYMVDDWRPVDAEGFSVEDQSINRWQAWEVTDFAHSRRVILDMDSEGASRLVPDGSLDFVFIDADHSYKGVTTDMAMWSSKLVPGGLLGGHDYNNPNEVNGREISRAVDEYTIRVNKMLMLGDDHTWFVRT